jgi:5'-nucleotidase (lipoprotein e(P4) family)
MSSVRPPRNWHKWTGIGTVILAVATAGGVGFAAWQILDAAHARTAQDYLDLRKTFLELDSDLDNANRSLIYHETGGCPQWHALKRYWYFSETEWKVAKIDRAQRKNWRDTQLPQVAGSLKRPAYRGAFLEMRDSERWRNPDGIEFVHAVTDQYQVMQREAAKAGHPLDSLDDISKFQTAPACTETAELANGIHWYRDSAEMKAIYLETYRAASEVVREAAQTRKPGTWAVVLDIDETVLDNSEYQQDITAKGVAYSNPSFLNWVKQQRAPLLPGAGEFVRAVKERWHGKVAFVTNQNPAQCLETIRRLQTLQISYDRLKCDEEGTHDKNKRFDEIKNGSDGKNGNPREPRLDIVLFVGDNIRDFPDLNQRSPGDSNSFGTRYFVLPNPMYGSWVDVPKH